MSNTTQAATVEVLTAEVRVLMIGHRQVTMSVYKQLDWVKLDDIKAFGRVNDGEKNFYNGWDTEEYISVVGADLSTGSLVRARLTRTRTDYPGGSDYGYRGDKLRVTYKNLSTSSEWHEAEQLPLIVLAGLR